ncbi:MAG: ECF transporter S component [Desulfurococcaceae archaeon]
MSERRTRVTDIVLFTVLVYSATVALQVYQPVTGGYFNLGESMIYTAAIVSTPLVAGLAGGIGASLADLSTGYAVFAPGTLIIKFVEGYAAGLLLRKLKGIHGVFKAVLTSSVYAFSFLLVSTMLWSGGVYVGPSQWLLFTFTQPYVEVSTTVWISIGVFIGGLALIALLKKYISSGEICSFAIAGLLMVLGYFLYEYYVSNPLQGREPLAAIAEIPVNFGQVIAGISISTPIIAWLRKAGFIK